MTYRLAKSITGQFQTALRGISLDPKGHIFAAGDSHIKAFDLSGKALQSWQLAKPPHSVAVNQIGFVFSGRFGGIEAVGQPVPPAQPIQGLLGPATAIGFVPQNILVGDAAGRCIRRYGSAGKHLNNIGADNPLGGFHIPNGVVDFAVDEHGVIHVANPGKHRVERYSPDGKLLGHFGRFTGPDPSGFSGCCNPTNVAVASGRTAVTEKAGARAKLYDSDGNLLALIESPEFDPTSKNMDIALDAQGRIYIAEPVRLKILIFEPEHAL